MFGHLSVGSTSPETRSFSEEASPQFGREPEHQSLLFYALKNHFYAEDIIGTGGDLRGRRTRKNFEEHLP